jgi:uncharacterized protein affecting Mg2+/Co2+ transport
VTPVVVSVGEKRRGIDLGWIAVMLVLLMMCMGAALLFEVVETPDFAAPLLDPILGRMRDNLGQIFNGDGDGTQQNVITGNDGDDDQNDDDGNDGNVAAGDECNVSKFVRETIPDHTVLTAGQAFTKSCTVRNEGTCTWTTGYSLKFTQGSQMGGEKSIAITRSVPPGDSYTFEWHMTAPTAPGSYTGRWDIFDDKGNRFSWCSVVVDVGAQQCPAGETYCHGECCPIPQCVDECPCGYTFCEAQNTCLMIGMECKAACSSDLDFDACMAAGGRWTEGLTKYWCLCP